jgi:hypothetical protein
MELRIKQLWELAPEVKEELIQALDFVPLDRTGLLVPVDQACSDNLEYQRLKETLALIQGPAEQHDYHRQLAARLPILAHADTLSYGPKRNVALPSWIPRPGKEFIED